MKHEFTIEQWMKREDRSQAPQFSFMDFTGMFGENEMECGIADICNKAKDDGCLLANVYFDESDLKSDRDAFRELHSYGWIIESHGRYKLDNETVRRVHHRHPHL